MSQLDEIRARDAELHGELSKYNAVAIHDRCFLISLVAEFQKEAADKQRKAFIAGWRRGHSTHKPADVSDYSEWIYAMSEGHAIDYADERERIDAALKQGGGS